ncbi:hypothetical protein JTB14_021879 [Gonioctena quinquepunctata]|nr:hypothetical protein JTB14_021879 [Gonioctena quinquepunctata]
MQSDLADIKKSIQFMSDSFGEQKKATDTILLGMRRLKEDNTLLQLKVREMEQIINTNEQKEKEVAFEKLMQSDLADIKKSIQFMSDSFEEQKKATDTILLEMRRLTEDNTLLQSKVREMEQIMNTNEQKEKEGNVILAGIPKQEDEPKTIADKVFKAMKVEVKESDIQDIYRLTKRGDGPILIKLRNKELRLKLQEKIREIKGIKMAKQHLYEAIFPGYSSQNKHFNMVNSLPIEQFPAGRHNVYLTNFSIMETDLER